MSHLQAMIRTIFVYKVTVPILRSQSLTRLLHRCCLLYYTWRCIRSTKLHVSANRGHHQFWQSWAVWGTRIMCAIEYQWWDLNIRLSFIPNSAPHARTHTHKHTHTNTGLIKYAATPPNQPLRCILTDYFNNYNFSKAQIIRSLMVVIEPKHVGAVWM